MNIVSAMKNSPYQIAKEVHRLSETEFTLIMNDVPTPDKYNILDFVKGIQ